MTINSAQRRKRGFNLIEIAIVLAVIGLVIGGIYTAASAVTERNRIQQMQKDILQIAANIRNTFANQPQFEFLTIDQIKAVGIMPGDMPFDGTNFQHPFGGSLIIYPNVNYPQIFGLHIFDLPKAACFAMLNTMFGLPNSMNINLVDKVQALNVGIIFLADFHSSLSIADTTMLCSLDKNFIIIDFKLR